MILEFMLGKLGSKGRKCIFDACGFENPEAGAAEN